MDWTVLIGLIIISIPIIGILIYLLYKWWINRTPGNKCDTNIWDSKHCHYVKEKTFSNDIKKPQGKLYLTQFYYADGGGYALCDPMWYAYRYVRLKDGAYGPLSDWSILPIFAGSTNLPCLGIETDPMACKNIGIEEGKNSLTFNMPILATKTPMDYSQQDGYMINVHRKVGKMGDKIPPAGEGDIIGLLMPSVLYSGQILDGSFNPIKDEINCKVSS